jgi:hypothetical protein
MRRRTITILRRLSLGAVGLLLVALVARAIFDASPIVLESIESKTADGSPVYNRIMWIPGWKKDAWILQQSHHGLNGDFRNWDRLRIEVDTSKSPMVARFAQFDPGTIEISHGDSVRPFRVPCYTCHPNGPRLVRPNLASKAATLSLVERIRVRVWNWRIGSYGRVIPDESQRDAGGVPFRYSDAIANQRLDVGTCTKCHNDTDGRGHLVRQNASAIRFMLAQNLMPPPGVDLKAEDKVAVGQFLDGRRGTGDQPP